MSRRTLQKRKTDLLRQIQQQRLDLSVSCEQWLDATSGYDRGWQQLMGAKRWLVLGGGALALWSVRNPRKVTRFTSRWARRGLGAWSTWRMLRNYLPRR